MACPEEFHSTRPTGRDSRLPRHDSVIPGDNSTLYSLILMNCPARILIADDHTVCREGLKQVISSSPVMIVAGEASNGQEALRLVTEYSYDLLVLDITMPGRNGLDVLGDIKEVRPSLPVLVLSMHPEELYAIRAIKSGASGYLTKDCSPQEFLDVATKVMQGKRYISPEMTEALLKGVNSEQQATRHNSLSNREYQVLCMIASGKPASNIADELSLSVKTVYSHRSHIFKKMRMSSNTDVTRYAIENNLV